MFQKKAKIYLQKGFTLIELLVVIGILGILAAALVATIDPFEQLRKAQDSNLKNLAVEFLNANIRYYTTHNSLPWWAVASGGVNCYTSSTTLASVKLSDLATNTTSGCIAVLQNDGELKPGFINDTSLSSVIVNNPDGQTNSTNDTSVCFLPTSKSQQRDPNSKYDATGKQQASGTCKSDNPTTGVACYWCAK